MQKKEISQYEKMTNTPIPQLILTLSVPSVISMLVNNVYNLVDTAFVGRLGTSASGAVGLWLYVWAGLWKHTFQGFGQAGQGVCFCACLCGILWSDALRDPYHGCRVYVAG